MEFQKPTNAVQFVVLSTAELLPLIHDKLQKYISGGEFTGEMLKNFHILHTTHSLLIAHSTTMNYLIPRIERRLKANSEKATELIKQFGEELKKAKISAESIIATLAPFDMLDVVKLIRDAIERMKTPKPPKQTKMVKVGSGDSAQMYVVGGATRYHIRDKKLARKYGTDDDIFPIEAGETLKDVADLPISKYFDRIIKQYKLRAPVKAQLKMSKPSINAIGEKMKCLRDRFNSVRDKYEQSYVPSNYKLPSPPVYKNNIEYFNNARDYMEELRKEIARMLAYIAVDKNNRNGTVVEQKPGKYPQLEIPQLSYFVDIPKVPNGIGAKSATKCGCIKDKLINMEKALEPYSDQVELIYGELATHIRDVLDGYDNYDPIADLKNIKKYSGACASCLKEGETLQIL